MIETTDYAVKNEVGVLLKPCEGISGEERSTVIIYLRTQYPYISILPYLIARLISLYSENTIIIDRTGCRYEAIY